MARVLIADDAAIVRLLIGQILDSGGHEIAGEATTGDETIRLYAETRPDVAVIDINMPGVNGLEAARAIRQLHPSARLVIMSVLTNARRLTGARTLDAVFLEKPFAASELLNAIAQIS